MAHRAPIDREEAKRNEVAMDGCVWCHLTKSAWDRNPDCDYSDPMDRPIVGYSITETKAPWEGRGTRVLKPWMVGPDDSRYGHAFKVMTVVDLIGCVKALDEEQALEFWKLLKAVKQ